MGDDIWGLWQSSQGYLFNWTNSPWEGYAKAPSQYCESKLNFTYIEFIMPSEICVFCFAKVDWGSECPKYPVRNLYT